MAQHRFRKAGGVFGYCECGWLAQMTGPDSMTDDELFINDHLALLAVNAVPDQDPVVCQILWLAATGDRTEACIKAYGHEEFGDAERDGEFRKHESSGGRKWMG